MTREVRNAVGKPDSSVFVLRCILYGAILAAMLIGGPILFEKLMVPMAADGMAGAWHAVFIPLAVVLMGIDLFFCWRRRWPLAYMREYNRKAQANGLTVCPRCGASIAEKKRSRYHRVKVGEEITTTTYSDGSKTVDRKDVYGSQKSTETYYACTNPRCALEVDQEIGQTHLPWKKKEIRCLVLNEDRLLGRKHPSARSILLSRLLAPALALILVVACGIVIYRYADYQEAEWTYTNADKEPNRSAEAYQDYLLSLDDESLGWFMTYEKEPSDMLSYLSDEILGKSKATGYSMGGYVTDDGIALVYEFEGDDAGTGIPNGSYTLANVDGIPVLLDDDNEKIYKQGTEFYETYAPKLQTLSCDGALGVILERVAGGEHAMSGTNNFWMEFIRKDNSILYSYMLSQDVSKISGGEFRAVTTYPEELVTEKWIFSFIDYSYNPVDLEDYVYSDAAPENPTDELGKLLKASSDGNGDFTIYKNEREILDISIDYLANGYEFEFDTYGAGFDMRFEEGATYRVNVNTQKLIELTVDENYHDVETELPLPEYQEEYDYLLSIVPETYIRSIIDLDKAEVKNENAGLVKNYRMKDQFGEVVAELKVAFGVIGEVIHHIGENEYVKIELSY